MLKRMRPELQEIADEAARILAAPTTVEDRDFNLIAHGAQPDDIDPVREASILLRRSSRAVQDWFEQFGIATSAEPVRTPADPEHGVRSRLCLPARWRGVTYGYIWVLDEHRSVHDPAVREVAGLAEHAAAYLAQQNRQRENEALLLTDLLSADSETVADAASRVVDAGLIGRGRPVAAVVVGLWRPDPPTGLSVNLWQLPRPVLSSADATSTTMLVPLATLADLEPARAAARRALELYKQRLPPAWTRCLVAGIGAARADLTDARGSWQQARLAARVADAVPGRGPVATWDSLGVYRLLAADAHVDLAALILDDPVRRLLDSTELRPTITAYLEHAGNVQATAAALNIHRQTLYYRIAKAEQLTGIDLRTGEGRTRVHLALMMAPLLVTGPSAVGDSSGRAG